MIGEKGWGFVRPPPNPPPVTPPLEAPAGERCALQGGGGARGAECASRSLWGPGMERGGMGAGRVGGHGEGGMGPAFTARM